MVNALTLDAAFEYGSPKTYIINNDNELKYLATKEIDFFVNSSTLNFFKKFNINDSFLKLEVEKWHQNDCYLQGLEVAKNIKVVNDIAERAVQLTQEYINVLARDEDQKQYLLQVIKEYKKEYPQPTKECLTKKFKI